MIVQEEDDLQHSYVRTLLLHFFLARKEGIRHSDTMFAPDKNHVSTAAM